MGIIRRRQLMGGASAGPDEVVGYTIPGNVKKGNAIEVEHPDCFRFDWLQSVVGDVKFGYYMGFRSDYAILDGVRMIITSGSNGEVVFPNVSVGNHVAYIHTDRSMPSHFSLQFKYNLNYLRLPYNVTMHECSISSSNLNFKWKVIDVLCSAYLWQIKTNSTNCFSNADIIRVPIGAKQLYIDAGTASIITNKMVEVNFKY